MSRGQVTEKPWLKIRNAQAELKACEKCTGECVKTSSRYWQPVIEGEHVAYVLCEYGQRRRLRHECGRAQIPLRYASLSFGDYAETPDNSEALKMARWYIAERPKCSLYYWGGCGTGKTFLASLIAKEFLNEFKRVIFGDVPSLLEELKRTFDDGGTRELFNRYVESELLVMDDLGAGQLSDWSLDVLYRLINERYNTQKPLIITSNFSIDGLKKRLRDEYQAARIVSRLKEMCYQGYLGTKDRRQKQ